LEDVDAGLVEGDFLEKADVGRKRLRSIFVYKKAVSLLLCGITAAETC